ncbi:transposase [Corynebacterium tuberculostearicum]|uniref:transposase n=1 Tax=Corynebacterium tuberculostearicum TaxID=38304 RepID=UPI00265CA635|nr:transposase [Corynebacterium tuberculostearicum]WKE58510.1 transposase [Corynebacterium tuberculostearicum]
MSRYSEEFKRDAVALYKNNEELSLNSASAELGINRASLHSRIKEYSTGKRARIKAVHDHAQAANDSARRTRSLLGTILEQTYRHDPSAWSLPTRRTQN